MICAHKHRLSSTRLLYFVRPQAHHVCNEGREEENYDVIKWMIEAGDVLDMVLNNCWADSGGCYCHLYCYAIVRYKPNQYMVHSMVLEVCLEESLAPLSYTPCCSGQRKVPISLQVRYLNSIAGLSETMAQQCLVKFLSQNTVAHVEF
jgi:hypothetical protein